MPGTEISTMQHPTAIQYTLYQLAHNLNNFEQAANHLNSGPISVAVATVVNLPGSKGHATVMFTLQLLLVSESDPTSISEASIIYSSPLIRL